MHSNKMIPCVHHQ